MRKKKLLLAPRVIWIVLYKETTTASVELIKTDSGDKHNQMISSTLRRGWRRFMIHLQKFNIFGWILLFYADFEWLFALIEHEILHKTCLFPEQYHQINNELWCKLNDREEALTSLITLGAALQCWTKGLKYPRE